MKKTEYLNNALSSITAKNEQIALKRDALSIDHFENQTMFEKAIKSENCRIHENNTLKAALAVDEFSSIFFQHKIKIEDLLSAKHANTREFKKRFLSIVEAISKNDREYLLECDDKVFSAIASNRVKSELSLSKVMNTMNHNSKTQASYLTNLASYLNFAEKVKDNDETKVKFLTESSFFKKIMSLYA